MPANIKSIAKSVRGCIQSTVGGRWQVPEALQRQAVQLLEEHSWKEVCETLGISNGVLGRWRLHHQSAFGLVPSRQTKPSKRKKKISTPEFVELPHTSPALGGQDFIELCMPGGAVLRARGAEATETFVAIAASLLRATRASS